MPESYGLMYNPYGFDAREQIHKELAHSTNLDLMVRELTAHLNEGVRGRSCLIAGARGSGKTTLIARACQEVEEAHPDNRRLIRVRLHGPSLLEPPKPPPTPENPTPRAISIPEHVLKTVVVNLYQTAAEEVSEAFRRFVSPQGSDALELAAQLRLTLDGAPPAATLRFFWERAGALPGGVLFPRPPKYPHEPEPPRDRGAAEIVALATAADAYRSCSGQYKQERTDEKSAGDKLEQKTQLSMSGAEISKAVIGLTSGVAAGVTAAALGQTGTTAALVGALTTLASLVTLGYSRTRSRETTEREEITFLPDTSVSALVHRMLLLLRRLRQAGLHPVFIIDELDKVAEPVEPLNTLTKSLKFLFADEAFFCFLTDRSYLGQLIRLNREQSNSQTRTTYTNQLLVHYDAASVHDYLRKVIRAFGVPPKADEHDLKADAEAFRYILICRSRMLLFDLSQDLTAFTGNENRLNVSFEAPRKNLGYQCHLAVQLAIELVLASEFVTGRISRDANFAQTIYDALYYPVSLWHADQRDVDCSPTPLIEGITKMTGEPPSLELSDQDFLHTQVKALLSLLADLPELVKRLREAFRTGLLAIEDDQDESIRGRLINAIPKELHLMRATPRENVYQWDYKPSGVPFRASDIQDIRENNALWDASAMIEALANSLREVAPKRAAAEEVISVVSAAEQVIGIVDSLSIPIGVNS